MLKIYRWKYRFIVIIQVYILSNKLYKSTLVIFCTIVR